MSFSAYVRDYLSELVDGYLLLTVYDPAERYGDIAAGLAGSGVTVVDGRTTTPLEARAEAIHVWEELTAHPDSAPRLLIYRPEAPPASDEARAVDPLAAFEEMGQRFPRPGVATDTYRDLALQAYPDRQDDVESLFESGEPRVTALDALESDQDWPSLAGVTGRRGATEIILQVLDEEGQVAAKILADTGARKELSRLLATTLEFPESEVSGDAATLQDRLWKWLLFSEFALDLPEELSESLSTIPHASDNAQRAVFRICKRLRESAARAYIERATGFVASHGLDEAAADIAEFGTIDTFAFENAALLRRAVDSLLGDRLAEAGELFSRGRESIWYREDGGLQTPWNVISAAIDTLSAIEKAAAVPADADIVSWYQKDGSEVDRAYRSFAFVSGRLEEDEPWGVPIDRLTDHVSNRYRQWLDAVQKALTTRVREAGWPLSGLLRQDRVFSRVVEPHLANGRRVAFFLIDALRFELAEALSKKLSADFKADVLPAASLLPSKTPLGMAALGPENGTPLVVHAGENGWVVGRGETELKTAADRDKWMRAYKGDQVHIEVLSDWIKRSKSKGKLDEKVRLAVVRDTSIDAVGEASESALRAALENLMGDVARGVRKAFDLGFDVAVVAADHGFLYVPDRAVGDEVTPPVGTAYDKSPRYAFGAFEPAEHLLLMGETDLGYRLSNARLALPASIGTFGKPGAYVHGGLSLQEALIPVLTVEPVRKPAKAAKIPVALTYRKQSKAVVRSLRPALGIEVGGATAELDFEEDWASRKAVVMIDVRTAAGGDVAGQVDPNEFLDPDTGALEIPVGTSTQIPIRLNEDVDEPVVVRALDFETQKTLSSVHLELDILM